MCITALRVSIFNLFCAVMNPTELNCGHACCFGERHKVFCFSRKVLQSEHSRVLLWAWIWKGSDWDFPSLCKRNTDHVCMLGKAFFMCWGNFSKTKAEWKNTFSSGRFPFLIINLSSCNQILRCCSNQKVTHLRTLLGLHYCIHHFLRITLGFRLWIFVFLTGLPFFGFFLYSPNLLPALIRCRKCNNSKIISGK